MLFCGRVDSAGAGGIHGLPQEHEDIRVVVRTVGRTRGDGRGGQIETGHTLICLYWLLAPPRRAAAEVGLLPNAAALS